MKKSWNIIRLTIIAWIMIILCFVLFGCRTQYVAVPEYHTEYVTRTDTLVKRDSIHQKDSIMVKVAGDTVTVERLSVMYRDRWREKIVRDTVIRTDSVCVPYPVERRLSIWEKFKQDTAGSIVLMVLAVVIVGFFVRKMAHPK